MENEEGGAREYRAPPSRGRQLSILRHRLIATEKTPDADDVDVDDEELEEEEENDNDTTANTTKHSMTSRRVDDYMTTNGLTNMANRVSGITVTRITVTGQWHNNDKNSGVPAYNTLATHRRRHQ